MIEVSHISHYFGRFKAVDDISFAVEPGQVVGLLGPNGAGKSTTMRMLAGYLTPTQGEVRICGYDVVRQAIKAQAHLGYLPEGAPHYSEFSVREFLFFAARMRGLRRDVLSDSVQTVITKLSLEAVVNRPMGQLSKGYKRRVGLAQALVHEPRVLLLDEPTDGLDPSQKQHVRALIDSLARECAVLVSTHLLEEVNALCNRVLIIADGQLKVDATPLELERRSRYHGAVSFTADGAGVAKRMLERLREVAAVETAADGRITVFPRQGAKLLMPVQQLLAEQGLEVNELQLERGRLNEVFDMVTGTSETLG